MDAAALKTGEDFKRLSAQGMSAAEISAQCGISQAEVAAILNMNE